ncbi:hypothetical protein V474_07920 [Novosphingobium barchaimii LL02]|uniref:Uncharacterized protein n=1 Tax=Novosphingobium barchaimii LL02 TaxID=1114963 RepID=A0A0J7Y9L9_9SPHN|nr:hypothetical protein [Novosphingobium barchaimii]KMS60003.1 hypothetical protein V474_07920 [Novosphingobium barchaimii LL02]
MEYQSSKGAVEISTMPLSYAKNALNKLVRSGEAGRKAEVDALQAHVDKLTAEAEAATLSAPAPREAVIGDNGPPADEAPPEVAPKWEVVQIHMDDLLTEASNWADGVEIVSQSQADTVAALREKLQTSRTRRAR